MSLSAKILVDALSPAGFRLTTFLVRIPRYILAELNTHRALSKSTASSRAIPVSKRIRSILDNPFTPQFTKNKKGMSSDDVLEYAQADAAKRVWHSARLAAHDFAQELAELGVHKQHANRIAEPFAWVDVLISGTHWANFYHRRCSPLAQPEFRDLASLMLEEHRKSVPLLVPPGWVALPFVGEEELSIKQRFAPSSWVDLILSAASDGPLFIRSGELNTNWAKLSTARCARTSYIGADLRVHTYEEDTKLFASLLGDGHMSPFEHVAIAQEIPGQSGNFVGWMQLRKLIPNEWDIPVQDALWSDHPDFHRLGRVRALFEL